MMTGAPAPADNSEAAPAKSAGKLKGRKLSAAVRARMKAAQRSSRWAKVKGTAPDPTVKSAHQDASKGSSRKDTIKNAQAETSLLSGGAEEAQHHDEEALGGEEGGLTKQRSATPSFCWEDLNLRAVGEDGVDFRAPGDTGEFTRMSVPRSNGGTLDPLATTRLRVNCALAFNYRLTPK